MAIMATLHNVVDEAKFNRVAQLPYELRLHDFQMAVQDVYDLFYDVNAHLAKKGLQRLDDMLAPQSCPVCYRICSPPVWQSIPAY
jgi:hypothetical protein